MKTLLATIITLGTVLTAYAFAESRTQQPLAISIGSKTFTESVILGEIASQLTNQTGATATHRAALGGTRIVWEALLMGEVDIYPDYTGTIRKETLANLNLSDDAQLQSALAEKGLRMTEPIGFNNTYKIGVRKDFAKQHNLESISDLRRLPDVRFGFSNEFVDRADGWPGLKSAYQLPQQDVRGIDHDLAYTALDSQSVDAIDIYATDARIRQFDVKLLQDDLNYFPVYDAVYLYRQDLMDRAPAVVKAIKQMSGMIDEANMAALNARVTLDGESEQQVAADFVKATLGVSTVVKDTTVWQRITKRTTEHLLLVVISLGAATIVGIPLGIIAARFPKPGQVILGIVGMIQTIPSLALLVILIKPLGSVGSPPAIVALFLYSLLPLVRNTHAGLTGISAGVLESANALGLPSHARLRLVEWPIALPTILAGLKTAAVINIGFATLGALIGAGGYGQPILTGVRKSDYGLIMEGAIPSAVLAIVAQVLFELLERMAVSPGLRMRKTP